VVAKAEEVTEEPKIVEIKEKFWCETIEIQMQFCPWLQ
jgi:hypothetical protein